MSFALGACLFYTVLEHSIWRCFAPIRRVTCWCGQELVCQGKGGMQASFNTVSMSERPSPFRKVHRPAQQRASEACSKCPRAHLHLRILPLILIESTRKNLRERNVYCSLSAGRTPTIVAVIHDSIGQQNVCLTGVDVMAPVVAVLSLSDPV